MIRESMRVEPKTVLLWGVGLALGGAALMTLIPWIVFSIGTNEQSQVFAGPISVFISLVREIIVPLGTGLIAAGIVMGYLKRKVR
jgi:Na+/proline symporter